MAHVKLIQNDCFALGEELLHISDLVYQRGRICLALTAGVLQDVPGGVTAVLGNGFPPGGTKVEVTHGSAPDSSRLQHYLFMHVLCVPTVRYLHKCNFLVKTPRAYTVLRPYRITTHQTPVPSVLLCTT